MRELDDFFDAYDRVHVLATETPDWAVLRKHVRRRILAPKLRLAGSLAFLTVALLFGIFTSPIGYTVALGTLLALVPRDLRALREAGNEIAELSGAKELRALLLEKAQLQRAGIFLSAFANACLALLFFATGAIAAMLSKDFQPGVIAGVIMLGLAAFELLVRLPRASVECAALGEADDDEGRNGE